jgi:abortive infection bacteriophage resistance protein
MRTRAGAFFKIVRFMEFIKPPLSLAQQVKRLQDRGLLIPDLAAAEHYLKFIGYYRLSAYALPLQTKGSLKHFKPNVCFQDILNLYLFDRELRLFVMDGIERVEVAIRSVIINEMCISHGSHWLLDAKHFGAGFKHHDLLSRLDKELDIPSHATKPCRPHHERFINHYFSKYNKPALPPSWMLAELLSLGTWSLLFSNLKQATERKRIANSFDIDEYVLKNWLHALTHLRNICAHHARLWNRQFSIKPMIAKKHAKFLKSNERCYAILVVLWDLLKSASPGSSWSSRLADLITSHSFVGLEALGFPSDWRNETFWGLASENHNTTVRPRLVQQWLATPPALATEISTDALLSDHRSEV